MIQQHAQELFALGFKLCALKPGLKEPVGEKWNINYVRSIDEDTFYGLPLAINHLCTIDPDDVEKATKGMATLGFNLGQIMSLGVRTLSTRPGSGGRSTFKDPAGLKWIKFVAKFMNWSTGELEPVTLLELRATSQNLQDVLPGLTYYTKDGSGPYTQKYANGKTFADAPPLPADLLAWWRRMSEDHDYLLEQQRIFAEACGGVAQPTYCTGKELPFKSPFRESFNAEHAVEDILAEHGYEQHGKRWRHPASQGSPGVRLIPGKDGLWQSDNGTDPLNGMFDAWSAYVTLAHDGDQDAAEAEAAGFSKVEPEPMKEDDWGFLKSAGRLGERLNTKPPERKWLAKQRLIMGRAHIITGVGGSSKSTWAYQIAIGGVLGRLLWGWEMDRTGTVAMLMTEDCEEDAWETVWDVANAMGVTDEERALLGEKLRIWTMAGKDVQLLSVDKAGVIRINERGKQFVQVLKKFDDLVMFIIDPALAITEGDESSQKHQRFLGTYVDNAAIDTGACGLLVSHSTKASIRADEIGSHQTRGGGALTDAVRGEYVLRTMTEKEAKMYGIVGEEEIKSHVQLKATKGNKIPPAAFAGIWLYRGHGGVLEEVQLTPVADGVRAVGLKADESQALAILERQPDGLTQVAWRDLLIMAGVLDKNKKLNTLNVQMKRIREALLAKAKRIEEFPDKSGIYRPVPQ